MIKRLLSFAITFSLLLLLALILFPEVRQHLDRRVQTQEKLAEVHQSAQQRLSSKLKAKNMVLGAPIFIRIFKEESLLEIWLQSGDDFQLFDAYEICNFSGELGPKLKEGDRQSPEGFYSVELSALNPNSSYHLSFNLGFPNRFDRSHGRTGSFLMVHGDCVSIGCYAMTDDGIEEIYTLAEAALNAGQDNFQVHAFPFKMTGQRMNAAKGNRWFGFWQNLKLGFDRFEETKQPPRIDVRNRQYVLN